jgi:hypothetical protein
VTRSRDMDGYDRRRVRTWRRAPAPRSDASPLGEFRPVKGFCPLRSLSLSLSLSLSCAQAHAHVLTIVETIGICKCLAERLHVYVLVHDTAVTGSHSRVWGIPLLGRYRGGPALGGGARDGRWHCAGCVLARSGEERGGGAWIGGFEWALRALQDRGRQ